MNAGMNVMYLTRYIVYFPSTGAVHINDNCLPVLYRTKQAAKKAAQTDWEVKEVIFSAAVDLRNNHEV